MAAPTGLYSPRRIRRAVMGIVAMRRAKMTLAKLRRIVPSTREETPNVAVTYNRLRIREMYRRHERPERVDQEGPTIPHKQIFDPARVKTPQRGTRHRGEH